MTKDKPCECECDSEEKKDPRPPTIYIAGLYPGWVP